MSKNKKKKYFQGMEHLQTYVNHGSVNLSDEKNGNINHSEAENIKYDLRQLMLIIVFLIVLMVIFYFISIKTGFITDISKELVSKIIKF